MLNKKSLLLAALGALSLNCYADTANATLGLNLANNTQNTLVLDQSSLGQGITVTPAQLTMAPNTHTLITLVPTHIEPLNPYISERLIFNVQNAQKNTITEAIIDPPCRDLGASFQSLTMSSGNYSGTKLYQNTNCSTSSDETAAKLQVGTATIALR